MKDVSALGVERNLFRYRPISAVAIRATADASWQSVLRVAIAGIRAGSSLTVSGDGGLPAAVRRVLSDQRSRPCSSRPTSSGSNAWWARPTSWRRPRTRHPPPVRRVRDSSARARSVAALHRALAEAVGGDPDLAVYDNEVTTAGRLELLPFLHEQSVTITAHRFGNRDSWSESVI